MRGSAGLRTCSYAPVPSEDMSFHIVARKRSSGQQALVGDAPLRATARTSIGLEDTISKFEDRGPHQGCILSQRLCGHNLRRFGARVHPVAGAETGAAGGKRGWTGVNEGRPPVRGSPAPCSHVLMTRGVHDNHLVPYEVLPEQRKIVPRMEYREGRAASLGAAAPPMSHCSRWRSTRRICASGRRT